MGSAHVFSASERAAMFLNMARYATGPHGGQWMQRGEHRGRRQAKTVRHGDTRRARFQHGPSQASGVRGGAGVGVAVGVAVGVWDGGGIWDWGWCWGWGGDGGWIWVGVGVRVVVFEVWSWGWGGGV